MTDNETENLAKQFRTLPDVSDINDVVATDCGDHDELLARPESAAEVRERMGWANQSHAVSVDLKDIAKRLVLASNGNRDDGGDV